MAVTGDIDLTKGLDFYRQKQLLTAPKKRLPWSNIRNEIAYDDNIVETSYRDVTRWYTTTNMVDNNIINIDMSTFYPSTISSTNISSRSYTNSSSVSFSISYRTSRTSYEYRYDLIDDNIIDNYTNMNITIDGDCWCKSISSNNKKKKKFHLGDEKKRMIRKQFSRCCDCNNIIIKYSRISNITRCRKCQNDLDYYTRILNIKKTIKKKKVYNLILDRFNRFRTTTIPWDNSEYRVFYKRHKKYKRSIPWLSNLDSRIYDYYMEELREGEKDYSEYLTNMHWIGVERHGGVPTYMRR